MSSAKVVSIIIYKITQLSYNMNFVFVIAQVAVSSRCFSKVWNYYTKDSSGRVVCNVCSAKVSQGSSEVAKRNTSNMWAHLERKHKRIYLEAKGYVKPINSWRNTVNMHVVKLEHCEEGENELIQELKVESGFENL